MPTTRQRSRFFLFFFSSRRRHTRCSRDWSSDVCSSDLTTVPAGTVTFSITNAGSIPHGFEVEGHGIEKEIAVIQPGASDTLTLTLEPATYEVYCPVGEDSHKKLGMETHLKVLGARDRKSTRLNSSHGYISYAVFCLK